jgi:hypothetical protein
VECNSKFGGFSVNESPMMDFMHSNVVNNFQFLLMSSHFSTYVYNREGFSKLYRQMADQAWNDAIELIKYTTKRGGTVYFGDNFNQLKISDEKVKKIQAIFLLGNSHLWVVFRNLWPPTSSTASPGRLTCTKPWQGKPTSCTAPSLLMVPPTILMQVSLKKIELCLFSILGDF